MADTPSKMDTRNQRSFTFTFTEVGDKQAYIKHAKETYDSDLAGLIRKLLKLDKDGTPK